MAALIAALDLGASKTACVVARFGLDGLEAVVGCAERRNLGVSDGQSALRLAALTLAEAAAGRVDRVIFTVKPNVASERLSGAAALRPNVALGDGDVRAALKAAVRAPLPAGREAVHLIPLGYRLDDGPLTADPRGLIGLALKAEVLRVTAPGFKLSALRALASAGGWTLAGIVAAPYAAGLAAASAEQRQAGCMVIDLGAAQTGLAAFDQSGPIFVETLDMGQMALTAALAQALNMPSPAAEKLKREQASLAAKDRTLHRLEAPILGLDGRLDLGETNGAQIAEAITPPLGAILAEAAAAFTAIPHEPHWPILLTGGGGALPGLSGFAAAALARPARIAEAEPPPGCATALGALIWLSEQRFELPLSHSAPPLAKPNKLAGAFRWIRENF